MMQRVAVLGATGSIGTSALDVIARHPQHMRASVLAAGSQVDALLALCRSHAPDHAVIADMASYSALRDGLRTAGLATQAHAGSEALDALVASDACDTVVAAIVGAAGLPSTLAAARVGKRLLLANKESLVLAGELLMREAHAHGAVIVPIDSEHNAIFQCLADGNPPSRITLTASGGPFRGWSAGRLAQVTPAQAVAHPKWSMGPKISVDSATLMNKGLEVIEAHELFGNPAGEHGVGIGFDDIDVVVHPQSVVHSMVTYTDGSTIAQLSLPDMRLPIGYALAWPDRIATPFGDIDWSTLARLDFEPPDHQAFPCLGLAYQAGRAGGSAPAWLNAANEEAVAAFLAGRIRWADIAAVCAGVLDRHDGGALGGVDDVVAADARARAIARSLVADPSSTTPGP